MTVCRIQVLRGLAQGNYASSCDRRLTIVSFHANFACSCMGQVRKTGSSSLMANQASESQRLGSIHGRDSNSESIQIHVLASFADMQYTQLCRRFNTILIQLSMQTIEHQP
jgi:hypothetical protein